MDSKTSFNDLPVELMAEIFSNLPDTTLAVVRMVCRQWRDILEKFIYNKGLLINGDCDKVYMVAFNRFQTVISNKKDLENESNLLRLKHCDTITFGINPFNVGFAIADQMFKGYHVKKLLSIMKPSKLIINAAISPKLFNEILENDNCENLQILRLNVTRLKFNELRQLKILPKLRRLIVDDLSPNLEKLLGLVDLPVVGLTLLEHHTSDVFLCSHLRQLLSSISLENLESLRLGYSRICDSMAAYIRTNCPKLWNLEIHKMGNLKTMGNLTEKGLLHFLHLPYLKHLHVTFQSNEYKDWFLCRKRWVAHTCNPAAECPVGIDGLLVEWDDTCPSVDISDDGNK